MRMEKDPYFKPSVKIDFKTLIIIIIVLGLIFSIPFLISFIRSGGTGSLGETFKETLAGFKISTEGDSGNPFIITIPILNVDLNLTVVKQNPRLIVYVGLALFSMAILIGITLIRSLAKK